MPHVTSSCFPARPAGLATRFTRLRFVDIEGLCFAPGLVMIMQGYRYLENVDNRRLWTIGGRCQCSPRCDYPGSPWATRWFPTPRRTALMTLSQRGRSCSKTSAGLSGYTKTCTAEFCGHARRLPAGLQAHDHPKGSGQDSQHCPQTRGIHPNSNRRGLRWQPSPAQPASRGHYGAEGRCDAIRAREAAPVCPVTVPR